MLTCSGVMDNYETYWGFEASMLSSSVRWRWFFNCDGMVRIDTSERASRCLWLIVGLVAVVFVGFFRVMSGWTLYSVIMVETNLILWSIHRGRRGALRGLHGLWMPLSDARTFEHKAWVASGGASDESGYPITG